jgi:hypothetical protein
LVLSLVTTPSFGSVMGEEEGEASSSVVGVGEGSAGESSVEAAMVKDVLVLSGDASGSGSGSCNSVWMIFDETG